MLVDMIHGHVHPDFGAVTETLRKVTTHKLGGGGAVAVMHRGELVVDAWTGPADRAGRPWTRDTVALSFSTTKGVVATALHRLRDQGRVDYDVPVAQYWPEFAQAGKGQITVRHLLNHSAGMHRMRDIVPDAYGMLDWDATCAALAAAPAAWPPGTRHGYHGISYGFLVGEVLRRITGVSVEESIVEHVVKPLGLDAGSMTIGRRADEQADLAQLLVRFGDVDKQERVIRKLEKVRSVQPTLDAFFVPRFDELIGGNDVYTSELPALNGCFTARSLAQMYSALIDDSGFLTRDTFRLATEQQTTARDAVVFFPMRWRLGYHMAATLRGVLPRGFGHFGYGGSGAWGDPDSQVAVAFVCNRVAGSPFGDQRFLKLGAAAVRAAARR
jgi:CubicO group peptidase (beta-lactamase class C family)